jgi:hypothetical protein
MFTANVGTTDRILRILIGVALVVWFFMDHGMGFWHWAKAVFGVIALGTAVLNFCPLYRLLGMKTN